MLDLLSLEEAVVSLVVVIFPSPVSVSVFTISSTADFVASLNVESVA